MTSRAVNLLHSWATLLSGGIKECLTPEDASCVGGMAAVSAHIRHLIPENEPHFIVPALDKRSAFVQMHPLGWNVNKIVLHDIMGWSCFAAAPSILVANGDDYDVSTRDLSLLQSADLPLLLTNAAVPPTNSWHYYLEAIHFDAATGLAVLSVADSGTTHNVPQVESALGALDYIAKTNKENESCGSTLKERSDVVFQHHREGTDYQTSSARSPCWVPVIYYADSHPDLFRKFIAAVSEHSHPPGLVVDVTSNDESYVVPQRVGPGRVWVVSYMTSSFGYYQHRIVLDDDAPARVRDVMVVMRDMREMPETYRDDTWASQVTQLRDLAADADANDPVIGLTAYPMPAARDGTYRRCYGGECEIGNVFADALRWKAGADVAFITSGGVRGPGWEAGRVHCSDLWSSLPFPNTMCTGVMSGVSLFRLLDYSIGIAPFEASADTKNGGRLLQVSGMRVVYNTKIEGSRLISVDVWDNDEGLYLPLDRLRLYGFATDSFLCGVYAPFPSLLGKDLVVEGEKNGTISDLVHQTIVEEYLTQLGGPYDNRIQGRLRNDTDATDVMNLNQAEEDCDSDTFWVEKKLTCMPCPNISNVVCSDKRVALEAESGSKDPIKGRVVVVNRELFPVYIVPENLPSWAKLSAVGSRSTANTTLSPDSEALTVLASGESFAVEYFVNVSGLEEGTAQGAISFKVLDERETFRGCKGKDASFDLIVRIYPSPEFNHLGGIRAVGLTLMSIVVLTSVAFVMWVVANRRLSIVTTLQPSFLIAICLGVLLISTAIIPLSVDDGTFSVQSCDVACMAIPWLIAMGLTISFSALFTKLWRINRLFNSRRLKRIQVKQRIFFVFFSFFFTLNFSFLLTWTLVDPPRWKRSPIDGEMWNTYGSCKGEGAVSDVMLSLVVAVNAAALVLACFEAYKARYVSDEFSESKYLGVALYSWLQLSLVGLPVLFLIDEGNPTARYFLHVALLFAICMSMLLLIFAPVLKKLCNNGPSHLRTGSVHVSGVRLSGTSAAVQQLSNSIKNSDPRASIRTQRTHSDEIKQQLEQSFPDNLNINFNAVGA